MAGPVGVALPAILRVLGRLQPFLHHGLRRGRGLGDPADPAHIGRVELGYVLRAVEPTVGAVEPTVGDVDPWGLATLPQLLRQGLHRLQQRPFVAGVAVERLEELRDALPRRHQR